MIKAQAKAKNRARISCSENHRDRARDPSSPRLINCHLLLKDKGETMKDESGKQVARSKISGILAICPGSDKEIRKDKDER
jgi:hypothetical protein